MQLFDRIDRHDDSHQRHAESLFEYINRSARPDHARMREVLEAWFARYPEGTDARRLRGDLRSRPDSQYRSACFELCMHELLLRLGCSVEVHPQVPGTPRHPEFAVVASSGERFFLEAVVATCETKLDAGRNRRAHRLWDALDGIDSRDFWIGVAELIPGPADLPQKWVTSLVVQWLASLDAEWVDECLESGDIGSLPRWVCKHRAWYIDVYPVPKPAALAGVRTRAIVAGGWEQCGRYMMARREITKTVVRKADSYGDLHLPYVIAVNTPGLSLPSLEVEAGLYGQKLDYGEVAPGQRRFARILDGAWGTVARPRLQLVSAVLMVDEIIPFDVDRATARLYHNPCATRPYCSELTRLPQAILVGDNVEPSGGESLRELLGLPEGWPIQE